MKKVSFVWSCCVMTFFVACQQAEVENLKADDLRMSIVASINDQKEAPDSRYAGETPDKVEFTADDAIGLFVDNNPVVEWVYDGEDDWSSGEKVVYWPDKTKSHTFRAFYPYPKTETNTNTYTYTSVPMPSLLNQTGTIESISECDFLVATKSQTYTDGKTVEFKEAASFKHVSSLLKLTFNGGGDLEGSVLTKITVTGNGLVASSTYAFGEEGGVSLKLKEDSSDDVLVASLSNKDGEATMGRNAKSFYLIVNARTKEELSTVSLTVEYKKGVTSYVASLENLTSNGFVGGTCQSYTFTIKDASISIVGSSIEEWSGGESLDNVEINGEETTASV